MDSWFKRKKKVPTKELWTEDNTNKESTGEPQENRRVEGSP